MDQKNKKSISENTLLNTDVSGVFVVHNSRKRPFIEQFEHTSVNFTQKDLGVILGFFIVRNESPSSENIVNFLTSETKKQYFLPNDKAAEEKFESTLHRINRALEEIANIGNVEWLGSIEGVVCVIANDTIYFSVTGNAHILLLRNNTLIDISEGLASAEAVNYPLKTFVDISSGEIVPNDKIILTSHELLELVSLDELQKNAIRMGEKGFLQFIETVLTNECSLASTTIINVTQKDHKEPITHIEHKEVPENFFAANAFEQTEENDPDEEIDVADLTKDPPKEYTDPRTGHIHIQGGDAEFDKPSMFNAVTERANDAYETVREFTNKKTRRISKKISSQKDKITSQLSSEDSESDQEIEPFFSLLVKKIIDWAKRGFSQFYIFIKKTFSFLFSHSKKGLHTSIQMIRSLKRTRENDGQYSFTYAQDLSPKEKHKEIFPHVRKVKMLWRSMKPKTQVMTIGILVFIIIAPLIFSFTTSTDPSVPPTEENNSEQHIEEPVQEQELSDDQSSNTIATPIDLYQGNDIKNVLILKNTPLVIESDAIVVFDGMENERFTLPEGVTAIAHATLLDDLNLIFFVTSDDQIYSFSPVAKRFQQQQSIPEIDQTQITALSTYLTYFYILTDNTITRHTRIENGFDDGVEWLEDDIDLSRASSFMINEEIFIVQENAVLKFASGTTERYTKDEMIENVSLLYTTEDLDHVWILDTGKTTLYKTNRENGSVIDSYVHTDFASVRSFAIDEEREIAIVANENDNVVRFTLE